jgi:hypothetical protein
MIVQGFGSACVGDPHTRRWERYRVPNREKDTGRIRTLVATLVALVVAIAGVVPAAVAQDGLRYEISLSERELYEFVDGEIVNSYPVSVGQPGHETPTGEWGIHRVDWNPDWTPPDSDWAAGAEPKDPGEAGNPMGRARIVYNMPYTIHGTEDLASLGNAESHGSVRVANDVAKDIARRVMEHGGASRSEEWYRETVADPYTMRQVDVPNPIPIVIYE